MAVISSNKFLMPWLALIFILSVAFIIKVQDNALVESTRLEVKNLLEGVYSEQKNTFNSFLNRQFRHLTFLLDTPPIQGISRSKVNNGVDSLDGTKTDVWLTRLAQIFSSLASNYQDIAQIRLIDAATGFELVRVDKIGQDIQRVIETKLQNKGDTDYFKKTLKLPEHTVYISELDLNRENGVIEYPVKPTIRFSIPVYNELNQLYSLLIINISATELLSQLQDISDKHDVRLSLLDQYENIIEHSDGEYRFTKDLAPEVTWSKAFKTEPWDQGLLKFTNKSNEKSHFISLFKDLIFAPIEFGGANKFSFINYISEQKYEKILQDKRLANLGSLAVIFLIFIVISVILLFYIRSAAQLRKTRTQFAAIIQGASDGIIAINHKLEIESFNIAAAQFFPELSHFKSKQKLADISCFCAEFIDQLIKFESSNTTNFQVTSSNKVTELRVNMSPILDDKNVKIGNALFVQDISEQIRYENEITEINASLEDQILARTAELEQERKNAVNASNIKSKFVSTISHEMRTPLNGILGSLNLMSKEKHEEHIASLLDMMHSSASSLSTLINDVLDLSKIEAGKLEIVAENCNVIAVIEDTVISLTPQAYDKNVNLEFDVTEIKHFSLKLDSGRLIQILNNLIGNALKFTLRGGVYISARTRFINKKIRLEVDIKDTGIGIAKDLQSKLFQSFTQADNSISTEFGGTGLGLSISKQLCELMGGEISVVSEKDKGSTFSFYIDTETEGAKALPDTKVLNKVSFKLLLCDEYIYKKWDNTIRYFGGVVDNENPDYYVVDCHHSEYQLIKDNEKILSRSIFLSRHSETYPEIQHLFAFLNRPTKLLSFLQLFSTNTELLKYFTSKLTEDSKSEFDFPNLANKTYLVVDDNSINITIAVHLLHSVNAKTITALSGVEAIEKLVEAKTNKVEIDAILLDCQMPIMDGYETTQRIRKGEAGDEFVRTPIIALTANAMSDEKEKCLALGMNDYLTKPIDTARLFQTLNKFLLAGISSNVAGKNKKIAVYESLNFEKALERLSHNEELYKKLLEMFLDETPIKISSLQEALNSKDFSEIKLVSHALQGTTANISALQLYAYSIALEGTAKQKDIQGCVHLVQTIGREFQKVTKIIQENFSINN
ncbi:ATP-binding protein [Thalassotalea profundi]|nr:ATP-binding protein [Thalassotalea profundi]